MIAVVLRKEGCSLNLGDGLGEDVGHVSVMLHLRVVCVSRIRIKQFVD